MPNKRVTVIGIGPGGAASLAPSVRRRIARADIIYGGQRLLDMLPPVKAAWIALGENLEEAAAAIREDRAQKHIVVLASGDPGFFGIARYLTKHLGKNAITVIPGVSAMQLAFARIGESWEDAAFVSAHGRPVRDIVPTIRHREKICIFTDNINTPAAIAKILLEHGFRNYRAHVCENLGQENERILSSSLEGLQHGDYAPLNTLILIRKKPDITAARRRPGIPDDEFYRRRPQQGLITKQEIRAISLSRLRISPDDVIWDIGAGSGAVAVEASFPASRGRVYAIEKNAADADIIRKNVRKFGADNVIVVRSYAPEGLDGLPDPDGVFIGGTGQRLEEIARYVIARLKPGGRLAFNFVGLENLHRCIDILKTENLSQEITMVNIARSTATQDLTRLAALNPVFIVAAVKPEGASRNG